MRMFRHRRKQPFDAELNITAFMNLMVVLVPFLLITAVFSQVSILELQLPGAKPNDSSPPKGLGLEVLLFNTGDVHVRSRQQGMIATFEDSTEITSKLNTFLQQIKDQTPSETAVTLRIEDAVTYEDVIRFMDAVRLAPRQVNSKVIKFALFPDVAISSLPSRSTHRSTANATAISQGNGASG